MNRILLPFLFLFAISVSAQQLQQTANGGAVQPGNAGIPDNVKAKFAWLYPSVGHPSWQIENGRYIAEFKDNGAQTLSFFDRRGTHVMTKTTIAISELPTSSASYIQKNYPSAPIESALRIESSDSGTRYEVLTTIDGKRTSLFFLASGEFFVKQDNKTK